MHRLVYVLYPCIKNVPKTRGNSWNARTRGNKHTIANLENLQKLPLLAILRGGFCWKLSTRFPRIYWSKGLMLFLSMVNVSKTPPRAKTREDDHGRPTYTRKTRPFSSGAVIYLEVATMNLAFVC